MGKRTYTIGQVARLSGVSVRRLRFYADEGLLPPAGRTESGYRIFSDADLVRVGLIRSLRHAGVSLELIRSVLARQTSIKDVLSLRLAEIETQISSQRRVAAALRAALRSHEPSTDDLRRIWAMINLSQAELSAGIERFFDRVVDDVGVDPKWKPWMLKMSTPDLPDDPSAEQIDAWIELSKLMNDPAFINQMRDNAKDSTGSSLDRAAFKAMEDALLAKAREAISQGIDPASETGRAIADEFLDGWARAKKLEPDAEYLARMRRKFLRHHSNTKRYWELVLVLKGQRAAADTNTEAAAQWRWIDRATRLRLAEMA